MTPTPDRRPGVAPASPRRATVRRAAAALAAAGLIAAVAAPAPAAAADGGICNKFCDARDPANALKDRAPVTTTLHGRTVALHVDDGSAMAFGTLDNVVEGDKVWVERSFDGGRTWDGGSRLGDTTAPGGVGGWRTQMYNVDDWNTGRIGALRACAQVTGDDAIACTGWARSDWNSADRRQAAATALMMSYDRGTGLFGGDGWWTGANALTALIDTIRRTGVKSYAYAVDETYDKNKDRTDGGRLGQFRNEYLDDTGWWGLAWVRAYDLTGDTRYLDTARADADHMAGYWTDKCGGGVQWKTDTAYKNAVTNELYIALNAALHNRTDGDTRYLDRATSGWNWLRGSGMINGKHLVNDGLNDSCQNNGQPTWTYNQGVILGGLAELHQATGDGQLLRSARELADASTGSGDLNPGGILREPGESNGCTGDGPSFKGAYVRGLGALNRELDGHPYDGYLKKQADTAYAKDRNALDQYGPHWNGDRGDGTGYGCQHSAVDLLNAAP
ncbi:glycoside hydrolase family 76 protein [Streptomyces sp. BBFR2]|uniref:glycoside hydrolase family 76 protein n=1 Tax=Streptomyces sp. BBFR2 TaxID=3372854 RepID=UPI0037DA5A25